METFSDTANSRPNIEFSTQVAELTEPSCYTKEECEPLITVPKISFAQQTTAHEENIEKASTSLDSTSNQSSLREPEDIVTSDQISSKSTSVSELEDGQIVESSSSECSDVFRDTRSNLKRPNSLNSEDDFEGVAEKRAKKKISFSEVTAYYFPRAQGFTCVPSQGGSTLGMALRHTHMESLSISEHAAQQRKNHRRLLRQLKKKRKNKTNKTNLAASGALNTNDGSTADTTKDKEEKKESDSEESDDQWSSDISDSELDIDNYYFLQPVPTRQRRSLLREAGVVKIETTEKDDCRQIRVSRESCGCSCQVYCEPESCSCAQSGIQCQVDRLNFPCGCSRDACGNPSGRVEFNPVRVRTHFIHTLMRLELENGDAQTNGVGQHSDLTATDRTSLGEETVSSTTPLVATVAATETHYNWNGGMQLSAPSAQQQQRSPYCLSENSSLTDEASWSIYSSYPAETTSYGLYSGVPSTTEVFTYDQAPYNSDTRMVYSDSTENVQQYTQLVDGGQGYSSEYYPEPVSYNGFEHGYSYNFPSNLNFPTNTVYEGCSEESYSYMEDVGVNTNIGQMTSGTISGNISTGSTSTSLIDSNSLISSEIEEAPKIESSSSSEEDALDMSSSLATIVKETMVSV